MVILVNIIYGVSIGAEYVPEERAWILDLLLIRFVFLESEDDDE